MIGSLFAQSIPVNIVIPSNSRFKKNSVGLLTSPLEFKNVGNKTIKYMDVEINAYNRVDDVLEPFPGNRICKITGPIQPNSTYSSQMGCSTYYDNAISYLGIRVVSVEYMDGTVNNKPTPMYIHNRRYDPNEYMFVGVIVLSVALIIGVVIANIFIKKSEEEAKIDIEY